MKRRSIGAKAAPCCAFCGKAGHYRSSCPSLAQKVLAAAAQHSGVDRLVEHVSSGKPLCVNVAKKPNRTLKRASGKRFVKAKKGAFSASKGKRCKPASSAHRKKGRRRKPKAKKSKAAPVLAKDVKNAWQTLTRAQWLRKPRNCGCGGTLVLAPWKVGMRRGRGRAFLRCTDCRKWFDVVTFQRSPETEMAFAYVASGHGAIFPWRGR